MPWSRMAAAVTAGGRAGPPGGDRGRATGADRECERVRRSAGRGASVIRSSRVTIVATWSLSARPLPVTAALTSLGVSAGDRQPAARGADDRDRARLRGAHHGPHVLCWLNTRSTPPCRRTHRASARSLARSRQPRRDVVAAGVLITSTEPAPAAVRAAPPPRRSRTGVRPGSMPQHRENGVRAVRLHRPGRFIRAIPSRFIRRTSVRLPYALRLAARGSAPDAPRAVSGTRHPHRQGHRRGGDSVFAGDAATARREPWRRPVKRAAIRG